MLPFIYAYTGSSRTLAIRAYHNSVGICDFIITGISFFLHGNNSLNGILIAFSFHFCDQRGIIYRFILPAIGGWSEREPASGTYMHRQAQILIDNFQYPMHFIHRGISMFSCKILQSFFSAGRCNKAPRFLILSIFAIEFIYYFRFSTV